MISIWKLIYELEYWIMIGTGNDIVDSPDNRPEYQHLVSEFKAQKVAPEKIPGKVLIALKKEAEIPFYFRPTFWRLVKLSIKKRIPFWR